MEKLKIKRVRLLYDEWQTIKAKSYFQKQLSCGSFIGKVALLKINQVSEPQFWTYQQQKIKVCDAGMIWFILVPEDAHYAITMMLDHDLEPVVWYIDLIEQSGEGSDGYYYIDDLFLDLIVYPDGNAVEEDLVELQMAAEQEVLSTQQVKRTLMIAEELKTHIDSDFKGFKQWCLEASNQAFPFEKLKKMDQRSPKN